MSNNDKNPFKAWALVSIIVSQLAGATLVGVFVGKWMDERFGTLPLFLLVGLFSGLTTGIIGMLKTVRHFTKEE